ncbi:gamma-glutamyl-gamma-aminobutyrate hydrolase family protein [Sandarakinorhabdus sp.]|uniref:gamma-glutamyl-gamma-aminobutyrate hydrolase family protein n=1 Tax=Sandarakinorhabdus sp. TaxID=1916663 RepID=UPI0033407BEA
MTRPQERPLIGIICCNRQIGVETAQAVMNRYVHAVARHATADAVLLPALEPGQDIANIVRRLDGVLLTGSLSNLEPARSGASDGTGPYDPHRDHLAVSLLAAAAQHNRPLFGICRGLQEINVALGGSLRADLAAISGMHHAPADVSFNAMFDHGHDVALAPGGVLAALHGVPSLTVSSVHFQGIAALAPGLSVEATAPDGLIEAVSGRCGRALLLGVQWHPEWNADNDDHSRAFFALLGQAARGNSKVAGGDE